MGRWAPDARGRLEQAALELFSDVGYEQTTVKQIAQQAGLTERTFFRHFTDKREVLFPQSQPLEAALVAALREVPAGQGPMEAVAAALHSLPALMSDRHELARRRQAVIDAHADLRERELIKLASVSDGLTRALRERGVPDLEAALAAEVGTAVLKICFVRWIGDDSSDADFGQFMNESLQALTGIVNRP
ncbi:MULTISPECIES: TetR/AcrR family transcriptional regulator [unclassified Streptomyces]|uniref:TetR/AcrR family transcriptional regulator n=1 Tax=unclassified Streptomyces TaxID=2593676 RepID=UPI00378973D0